MRARWAVWALLVWMAAVTLGHFVINAPYYQDKLGVFARFLARGA
jgi:hypothetical protein